MPAPVTLTLDPREDGTHALPTVTDARVEYAAPVTEIQAQERAYIRLTLENGLHLTAELEPRALEALRADLRPD